MKKNLSPWGRQVKIEQIKRGWDNQRLAEEAHLSKTYILSVVHGRVVSPRAVRAISNALDIAVPDDALDKRVTRKDG